MDLIKVLVAGATVLALPWAFSLAELSAAPQQSAPLVAYAPSARPDRIYLSWQSAETATTQSVNWRTTTSVAQPVAQIAASDEGGDFILSARTVSAVTTLLETPEFGRVFYHSVQFADLQPDTLYTYRVGERGGQWSEWFQFRTASRRVRPFTFLYFGDAQNNIRAYFSRLVRQAVLDTPDARFIVHAGDLVSYGDDDRDWGEWFEAAGWISATIPGMPVIGNHEYTSKTSGRDARGLPNFALTPHWRAQFALPTNGPAGLSEQSYYFDFQGVRMIALNCMEADSMAADETTARSQTGWIESLLKNNPNRWTIVSFHYPMFNSDLRQRKPKSRMLNDWKPLFDRYGVDLVLQGDEHVYARMRVGKDAYDAKGAALFNASSGPVYVTSIGTGSPYDVEEAARGLIPRTGSDMHLYQVIRIDGRRLLFQAKTADGRIYDDFELVDRGSGKPNQLVERKPHIPTHYFPSIQPASTGAGQPPSVSLDQYVGNYRSAGMGVSERSAVIRREANTLILEVAGQPPQKLSVVSPTLFLPETGPQNAKAALRFGISADGSVRWARIWSQYYERDPDGTN